MTTLSQYLNIQQIIMVMIMFLGRHLLVEKIPKELRGGRLHNAGRIMGVGVLIIPIASFIYYFSSMRYANPQFTTALNLSAYCLTSTFIAIAYYLLLGLKIDRWIIRTHLIIGILYPFPLWLGLIYGSTAIAKHTLIAAYTLFCVLALIHIGTCIYFFMKKLKSSKPSEMDQDQKIEMQLLGRTIKVSLCLICIGLFSPSFFAYPMWLGMVFVICFIGGITYIYWSYHRIISHATHSLNCAKIAEVKKGLYINDSTKQSLEVHLQQWLNKKEFLQPHITINDVSEATFTNRTYLSKYINSEYQCSFKSWITQLRIVESKQMMLNNPDLSIAEIATLTGFASIESFSHIFSRCELVTPTKWRETISDKISQS